tara:strand:- start:155 stop:1831 length:1677 start_codon:yes stop_codon:yes gene_type:complete
MIMAPLVTSFYPFAYNYAIKLFIDLMAEGENISTENLMTPILIFLGAQLILDISWRLSSIAEWKSEPFVRRSLLLKSYDYVQHHSFLFFQDNFTGSLTSKLKSILDGYDTFWSECHSGFLSRIFTVSVSISALFFINFSLGLIVCLWSSLYIPLMYRLSKRLNKISYQETESRHAIMGQISDKISNIMTLFSFATRRQETEKLDQEIRDNFIPKQIKAYKYNFKLQLIGGVLYIVIFTILLFYMIYLRQQNLVSLGDFAFVFGITLGVMENIWRITVNLQDFARHMGDFKSALSILTIPHEATDSPDAKPLAITQGQIDFKNISFAYDNGVPVFKNLDLTIKPGEKIGLVGPSGAGKSSLINLVLRYFSPLKGEILIDGTDIRFVQENSLRENIAVIPQDTLLFHRTLYENIQYGNPKASKEDVIKAAKKAQLHDFIMELPDQYSTQVGERGIKLSGGQRQRLAIARGFLKNARILILDEATSSLDSQTEKDIQQSLSHLFQRQNKTVIAIAHRLSTLKHMDRIIVLEKGHILDQGTHEELVNKEKSLYQKLWKLQLR